MESILIIAMSDKPLAICLVVKVNLSSKSIHKISKRVYSAIQIIIENIRNSYFKGFSVPLKDSAFIGRQDDIETLQQE